MGKKYELVKEESMIVDEIYTVYRVKALRDFGDVHAGDVGGWVEDDTCLSQDGSARVYDDAEIYGFANIAEHAQGGQQ